jgi:preprotein translocase subunit SecG
MTGFPFLAVGFFMKLIAALFLICAVVLILVILIQKGKGGGLGGAFGAAVAGGILGSKTGDFLTWSTIVMVGLFLTLAVVMARFYKPSVSDFGTGQPQQGEVQQEEPRSIPAATGEADTDIDINSLGG